MNLLDRDCNDVERKLSANEARIEGVCGSIGRVKSNIHKLKDVERQLVDLGTQHQLNEEAVKQCQIYYDAIEKGMMKFHQHKMESINELVKELWRRVYKGTDIESIQIKSDVEKTDQSRRLRSFNYRITLTDHNQMEIDMKGKCSAGQRVLASIIIRMALA